MANDLRPSTCWGVWSVTDEDNFMTTVKEIYDDIRISDIHIFNDTKTGSISPIFAQFRVRKSERLVYRDTGRPKHHVVMSRFSCKNPLVECNSMVQLVDGKKYAEPLDQYTTAPHRVLSPPPTFSMQQLAYEPCTILLDAHELEAVRNNSVGVPCIRCS